MTEQSLENLPRYHVPPITPFAVIVEWLIIVIVALVATSNYDLSSPKQLAGYEAEYLTSPVFLVEKNLREEGYIPLWNPWYESGEPLVENPFSFLLNPVSSVPTLIYGGLNGIKISVILSAIVAGWGGWALARVLGLRWLGRLLLALLCIGKGNMGAMIGAGWFQLGTSQAYIPWVVAGTIGILRFKHRRWPIVLTVLAFTLLFWAGNVWYTLPTLLIVATVTLSHIVKIVRVQGEQRTIWSLAINRFALRRMLMAGLLTVGFSAITLLPLLVNQRFITHPGEVGAGLMVDLYYVIERFFSSDLSKFSPLLIQDYYSFVLPLWFAILIFIVLPPIRSLSRPRTPRSTRVWGGMLFLFIFCTLWGAGINPIIGWLYATIPQAAQWRKVGRALAIASFCLAVLAAMRIDSLQHAIELSLVWQKPMLPRPFAAISPTLAKYGVLAVVTIATCIAALQVPLSWQSLAALDQDKDDICVVWLRSQYPTRELSVMSVGYYELKSYIKYSIRHWNIASNVHMRLLESTLFNGDLTRIRPDFAIANTNDERAFFASIGYEPVPESPTPFDQNHCVYHKTNAPSYAFSIPKSKLLALRNELPLQLTTPITTYKRYLDRIGLIVEGSADEPLVVTVQERAYPGWRVEVDGKGAQLESVGGQIGVVLPAGAGLHTVYFQYRPLLFIGSGILTLITWGVCILYLLRAERFIPQPVFRAFRRLEQQFQMVSARIHRMLFSPAFSIHDDSDT